MVALRSPNTNKQTLNNFSFFLRFHFRTIVARTHTHIHSYAQIERYVPRARSRTRSQIALEQEEGRKKTGEFR